MVQEEKFRDLLARGLPKIASAAVAGIYPDGFSAQMEASRDYLVDSQVVESQLVYTKNLQILSLLIMEPGQIMKLGQRVFPKLGRIEAPKMVVSANEEVLNAVTAKLGYLIGKVEGDKELAISPPVVLNCSGENGIPILGAESFFLSLVGMDVTMRLITSMQTV